METITDDKKIEALLTRGVAEILPSRKTLQDVLLSGRRLTLYQGFDPTGANLHLGHLAGLRKLAQFQALGHQVIFLIGDGTGQAGDPSGRTTAREKFFTKQELRANAKSYVAQASQVLRFTGPNKVKVLFNSAWLNKLKLVDILNIAEKFSLQQLAERNMFQERMKKGEAVNLREFLYPLLQGYDSVAMKVDLEIGGSDQLFNMLAGRTLMKAMLGRDKFVLTTPLLVDSSGAKIGKSAGNVIALTDKPADLYGKIMGLNDSVIVPMFECLTDVSSVEIKSMAVAMKNGASPLDYKKRLAHQIVANLNSLKEADHAAQAFHQTFTEGGVPDDVLEVKIKNPEKLGEVLVRCGLVKSKSEFRRLILERAIKTEREEKITDSDYTVQQTTIFKVGKRRFIKIIVG